MLRLPTLFRTNRYHSKFFFLLGALLLIRLPTKDKLVRRGIIIFNTNMEESVNHFFMGCDFLGSLWYLVRQWLGFFLSLNLLHVADHLNQLGNSEGL